MPDNELHASNGEVKQEKWKCRTDSHALQISLLLGAFLLSGTLND